MRATTAPASLTKRLTIVQAEEVELWWRRLSPRTRHALRRDAGRPPPRVVARFVDAGEARDGAEDPADLYEYLVNHEIFLEDGRPFHICSAHPEARALVGCGHVPAGFACPRAAAGCPLRALVELAEGRDVRLSLEEAEEAAHG